MPSSPFQMPSPCSSELERDNSSPPEIISSKSTADMLKIGSLLNPSEHGRLWQGTASPPPTPAYTQMSSAPTTPAPQTPLTSTSSPAKRLKLVKDAAIFVRGAAKEPVNHLPFECTEEPICLNEHAAEELARQHERFAIFPSGRGDEGLIADYQRHIPYSSDKKAFFGKTNRDAFEVFQYTFRVPGDDTGKEHVVMWDYQIGLVRITPFFKALQHSKTTPAKALTTNPGLKELSHSITGGALAAQGYWMTYSCARAICLTFCYEIRWALTPIFGPSFVKECLPRDHSGFGRFKVSSEVIRCAQREAEGFQSADSSRSASPTGNIYGQYGAAQEIPRSVPPPVQEPKPLRPRPAFSLRSPFASDSDSDASEHNYVYRGAAPESPGISPKSTRHTVSPGWTSINRQHLNASTPPPPPHNTPGGSLSRSLLTEPRTLPTTSWRGLEQFAQASQTPPIAHAQNRSTKRRISAQANDADYSVPPSGSSSESNEADIVVSPIAKKRLRREETQASSSTTPPSSHGRKAGKSTKYNAADARAAQWLLNLSVRDSHLAYGPEEMRGQKRRVSEV